MVQRCAMVAVLGQANAGKSTLVNALAGEKVSIVSAKPHTTRYDIYGIICQDDAQIIFVDTPGLIDRPQGPLQSFMAKMTTRTVREADLFMVVIDASRKIPETTLTLLDRLKDKKLMIVLNKVDQVPKDKLLPMAEHYQVWSPWIAMTSGKTGSGLAFVMSSLMEQIPEAPWLFDEDAMTQISQRMWAAEMTREKLFQCVHQEVPYHAHVVTDEWKEKKRELTLRQTIYVDDARYKKWIVGYQGQRIRLIGEKSRMEMSEHLDKTVHLFLNVLVDPSWSSTIRTA